MSNSAAYYMGISSGAAGLKKSARIPSGLFTALAAMAKARPGAVGPGAAGLAAMAKARPGAGGAPGSMKSIQDWLSSLTGQDVGTAAAVPAGLLGLLYGSANAGRPMPGQMSMPGSPMMPNFPIFPNQGMTPPAGMA